MDAGVLNFEWLIFLVLYMKEPRRNPMGRDRCRLCC
ncbi:hypothetical protein G4B88_020068 [Cannabis sativa]|uniref:Uncharacterized protein n=1 Tax=Cannabis sativa TaxID=3483 RepID=A0A7J6GLE0_CANSA|nr:hypothetical protein G4B88_020068 [Cannabis sativa]